MKLDIDKLHALIEADELTPARGTGATLMTLILAVQSADVLRGEPSTFAVIHNRNNETSGYLLHQAADIAEGMGIPFSLNTSQTKLVMDYSSVLFIPKQNLEHALRGRVLTNVFIDPSSNPYNTNEQYLILSRLEK